MQLSKVKLDSLEIQQLQQDCDVLRTCPNIGENAIGYHRSWKSLTTKLKDLQEEAELVKSNFEDKIEKIKLEHKDEKSQSYKDAITEANKELKVIVDKMNKVKHEVGVYIFDRANFPTEPSEFGEKEVVIQTKDDAIKHKINFWEAFVRTIDIIVLEKEEYEQKRVEIKAPKTK